MKRVLLCIMTIFLTISFVSCGSTGTDMTDNGKINIVCTIFPEYDWVRQIVGENDNVDITFLLDNSVDLHNYQPTAEDIIKISSCDMFIYVGGESDDWVENVLKKAANKDMIVINLMEILGQDAKTEEIIEGMDTEEDEADKEIMSGAEHMEYDEHVWLSLKNAERFCSYIALELEKLDSANSDKYAANVDSYIDKLSELDKKYQEVIDNAPCKTLLFADRFPFRYLVDDYNLEYYAAFAGCSAETEASFETVAFLTKKVDELNLKNIMVIDNSDQSIAETIVNNSVNKNQNILSLSSMQSIIKADVAAGVTYLYLMENNLEVLKLALN